MFCGKCDGSGKIPTDENGNDWCDECNGEGSVCDDCGEPISFCDCDDWDDDEEEEEDEE